jgi:prepilin-type N-terminal cleavage/methylation domain-containing protein
MTTLSANLVVFASRSKRGFTLAELVVAIVIGAVLAGGAAASMGNFFRTRNATKAYQQASLRANTGAARIAQDLASCVRHPEAKYQRLTITNGGDGRTPRDELLLLTRSLRSSRGYRDEPEGGEYEAQYRLMPSASGDALWRRFDPAFDAIVDGGGIATPIMPGAVSLGVDASDGSNWFETWDSDKQGLPHAVRVIVVARSDDGRSTAAARRIVAIDRVPLIPADVQTERAKAETDEANGTGSGGSGGGNPR